VTHDVPGSDGPAPGDMPDVPDDAPGDVPGDDAPGDDRESAYELLQRGRDLTRRRHYAQAAVVLERAARLEPGRGSILEALGRASFNAGHHQRAREVFAALLEVDPSSPYGEFGLGQSLRKLGRDREAWTHLRLAVALAPESALYRSALARVPEPGRRESDTGGDGARGAIGRDDEEGADR